MMLFIQWTSLPQTSVYSCRRRISECYFLFKCFKEVGCLSSLNPTPSKLQRSKSVLLQNESLKYRACRTAHHGIPAKLPSCGLHQAVKNRTSHGCFRANRMPSRECRPRSVKIVALPFWWSKCEQCSPPHLAKDKHVLSMRIWCPPNMIMHWPKEQIATCWDMD